MLAFSIVSVISSQNTRTFFPAFSKMTFDPRNSTNEWPLVVSLDDREQCLSLLAVGGEELEVLFSSWLKEIAKWGLVAHPVADWPEIATQ